MDIGVAALAASELATNVVQHARTFFTVSVIRSPGHLRVEFADGSRCPPVLQRAPRGEDGRGLLVVDAVADAWGAELTQSGKVVWFELQH